MELGQYWGRAIRRRQVHQFVVTENRFKPGLEIAPHAHTHPHFTFVLSGSFTERYGSRVLECPQNAMLFVPADATHTDTIGAEGAHSISVELSQGAAKRLSESVHLLRRAEVVVYEPILRAARRLQLEMKVNDAASKLCIESLSLDILALAARMPQPSDKGVPSWMKIVVERIHDDLGDCLSLESLAADAGVHPTHLSRTFKKVHGYTVGDYIRDLRIQKGAAELGSTQKTVAQISTDAGFCDQSHFCRLFRRTYGVSPLEYRHRA